MESMDAEALLLGLVLSPCRVDSSADWRSEPAPRPVCRTRISAASRDVVLENAAGWSSPPQGRERRALVREFRERKTVDFEFARAVPEPCVRVGAVVVALLDDALRDLAASQFSRWTMPAAAASSHG